MEIGANTHFRHAICNEAFEGWPFPAACRAIRQAGYTGIEIAPFTLGPDPGRVESAARREYRDAIRSEGLEFVGFHWIMAAPEGLHLTTPDPVVRKRSWDHITRLIDLCADLGGGVMAFGSPRQRRAIGGLTPAQATDRLVEGFSSVAQHACAAGICLMMEALSPDQCDVVITLADAIDVVRRVNSPAVRSMFDVHNALAELEPHDALIERYFDYIRHVHVNELDGRHCGAGNYDFKPVLAALRRRGYAGWLSLEAFDFTPGPERLAVESLGYLEKEIDRLPS